MLVVPSPRLLIAFVEGLLHRELAASFPDPPETPPSVGTQGRHARLFRQERQQQAAPGKAIWSSAVGPPEEGVKGLRDDVGGVIALRQQKFVTGGGGGGLVAHASPRIYLEKRRDMSRFEGGRAFIA